MYISSSKIVCVLSIIVGLALSIRAISAIGTDAFPVWTIAAFVAYINAGIWYIAGNIRRD